MTTAFVFITMMTIAQAVHMLFTIHHFLLVLRRRGEEKKSKEKNGNAEN